VSNIIDMLDAFAKEETIIPYFGIGLGFSVLVNHYCKDSKQECLNSEELLKGN